MYITEQSLDHANIHSSSFLGMGLTRLLVKVLILAANRFESSAIGTVIPFPCLSKGVKIEQTSDSNPLESIGEVVCWGTHPGSTSRIFFFS